MKNDDKKYIVFDKDENQYISGSAKTKEELIQWFEDEEWEADVADCFEIHGVKPTELTFVASKVTIMGK